jgi:hypothetical protein
MHDARIRRKHNEKAHPQITQMDADEFLSSVFICVNLRNLETVSPASQTFDRIGGTITVPMVRSFR